MAPALRRSVASKARRRPTTSAARTKSGRRTTGSVSRSRSARPARRKASVPAASRPPASSSSSSAAAAGSGAPRCCSCGCHGVPTAAGKPKRAMTGFQAFVQVQLKNKALVKQDFAVAMKGLGAQWRAMSDAEKAVYKSRAVEAASSNRRAGGHSTGVTGGGSGSRRNRH